PVWPAARRRSPPASLGGLLAGQALHHSFQVHYRRKLPNAINFGHLGNQAPVSQLVQAPDQCIGPPEERLEGRAGLDPGDVVHARLKKLAIQYKGKRLRANVSPPERDLMSAGLRQPRGIEGLDDAALGVLNDRRPGVLKALRKVVAD